MKTLLLALLLLLPCAAHAGQLSSDLRGQVVDAQGQPITGAVMIVEHLETGRVVHHTTGTNGRWRAQGLRSDGTYRVSCFAPDTPEDVVRFQGRVALGQVHERNCVLGTVGAQSPTWLSSRRWRQDARNSFVEF